MMEWMLVVILYSSNVGDVSMTRFNSLQECKDVERIVKDYTDASYTKKQISQCIQVQPLGATK